MLIVALVIGTITAMGATMFHASQARSDKLYREIDADIQQTLWQHEQRKLATVEPEVPAATTGMSAKPDEKPDAKQASGDKARSDEKSRKAKITSIRKRTAGQRRERFVPPDFARLPIAVARGALGFLR